MSRQGKRRRTEPPTSDVATSEKDATPATFEIASSGDVILIVGPENTRMRVQSHVVCSASKVFASMFGPNWREGSALSMTLPAEVPLVDDDAEAMKIICLLLHHRNDLIQDEKSPRLILDIGVASDKYDLTTALKFASGYWLKPSSDMTFIDRGYMLAASFLFKDERNFRDHSVNLIVHHNESYLELLEDASLTEILPFKTAYLLEESRTRLRASLTEILMDGMERKCSECRWGRSRSARYKELREDTGPLDVLEISVAEFISMLEDASKEHVGKQLCPAQANQHELWHSILPLDSDETFPEYLSAVQDEAGIELSDVG